MSPVWNYLGLWNVPRVTQEALLRLALKAGRAKLKTGWRRHIWTTSLVPRLIIARAASICGLQLRTLLYALSLAAAGCEPQQEPLKSLSRWGCEQWSLGWAGLWCSKSSDLSGQGGSICWRQGENPPSWIPRSLWQPVGMALRLPAFWAAFERAAVIAGAWHGKAQWILV